MSRCRRKWGPRQHSTNMKESCMATHIWMGFNESCHIYKWVMSHTWMSHVARVTVGVAVEGERLTRRNESCHTYEWDCNESCHTHECFVPHTSVMYAAHPIHATHLNDSCHTLMPHTHVTHMNDSCHTLMSHTWMIRATHSCHTHEWFMPHTWVRALP